MKCGREVAILGIGMHPWGMFPDKDFDEMGADAIVEALKDADLKWRDIQFMGAGIDGWRGSTGSHAGNEIIDHFGNTGIPVINIQNACATGVYVVKTVRDAIASGMYDIGIAIGAGKSPGGFFPNRPPTTPVPLDLQILRWKQGLANPAYWGMYMTRRMRQYGETEDLLAGMKVKASRCGALNPYARYRRLFTKEEVLKSPMVCSPLRLLEICATSQGAATVILGSMDVARRLSRKPITITAATVASPLWGDSTLRLGMVATNNKETAPFYSEGWLAAKRAFEEAGIGPEDIDTAELPDNSPWHEIEYFEVDGFCKPGEAGHLIAEGYTDYDGKLPVNMSGGMSSLGEVTNAQGIQQICDVVKQIRGTAPRQLKKKVRTAFCQTYGGAGNNSCAIVQG